MLRMSLVERLAAGCLLALSATLVGCSGLDGLAPSPAWKETLWAERLELVFNEDGSVNEAFILAQALDTYDQERAAGRTPTLESVRTYLQSACSFQVEPLVMSDSHAFKARQTLDNVYELEDSLGCVPEMSGHIRLMPLVEDEKLFANTFEFRAELSEQAAMLLREVRVTLPGEITSHAEGDFGSARVEALVSDRTISWHLSHAADPAALSAATAAADQSILILSASARKWNIENMLTVAGLISGSAVIGGILQWLMARAWKSSRAP